MLHDAGFFLFLAAMLGIITSATTGRWRMHALAGQLARYVVFPGLGVSGAWLCMGSTDWPVFSAYGLSWIILIMQQMMPSRRMRLLHGCVLMTQSIVLAWILCYRAGVWARDMMGMTAYIPLLHLDHMIVRGGESSRAMHMISGADVLYLGLMGTVFSLTHPPFMTSHWIMPLMYTAMHWVYHAIVRSRVLRYQSSSTSATPWGR